LEFNPDEIVYREPDYDKLINLFRELEFYSLIERFQRTVDMEEPEAQQIINIEDADTLEKLVQKIIKLKQVAVLADVGRVDITSYKINGIYFSTEDKITV